MARRKSRNAKERARLFTLHGGICHLCGGRIGAGEAWEIEHVIEWALTHDDSDENVKPAHVKCHAAKTGKRAAELAKVNRQREKFMGFRPKSKSPIPGSKSTKWKRKMNGEIVLR